MGVAHMLGVDGVDPVVSGVGPRTPLLTDDQVLLFGWGHDQARPFEHEQIRARGIENVPLADVAE